METSPVSPRRRRPEPPPSLLSLLRDALTESDFPNPRHVSQYLPCDSIANLMQPQILIRELGLSDDTAGSAIDELIRWIQQKAPRLFLITLDSLMAPDATKLCKSMKLFRQFAFDDSQLPWTDSSTFPNVEKMEEVEDDWTYYKWRRENMKQYFTRAQWQFAVPFISLKNFDYVLRPEEILPFTMVPNENIREGAFGSVYHVRIHPSQTDYPFQEVAVKEIKITNSPDPSDLDRVWSAEVNVLRVIRERQNPHLITCIAAIERGDHRFLLFPWADGGSLRDYFRAGHQGRSIRELILEALHQIKGLAHALYQLHYFGLEENPETNPDDLPHVNATSGGASGNVPELRINDASDNANLAQAPSASSREHADDVATEYNPQAAEESIRHDCGYGSCKETHVCDQQPLELTTTKYGTILYEAPEAEPTLGKQPRSRQYDIWSMGCIITEWIIWILYGNEQLERFYETLKASAGEAKQNVCYYTVNPTGQGDRIALHPLVSHWLSEMKNHPEGRRQESALRDLLALVEEKLLVFDLPPRRPTTMNSFISRGAKIQEAEGRQGNRQYRATAIEFENCLLDILDKAEDSTSYLLTSTDADLARVKPPPELKASLNPNMYTSTRAASGASTSRGGSGEPRLAIRDVRPTSLPLTQAYSSFILREA
ncbi:hypothetical protein Cob_v000471 [Colletotrichum orbiculare MAFF 240422]|uniref:Protein kinase domain-containing protein n=1 Tax=Colletotrichum orbiculare (strain 104-T / ATCC 96160 / CBS 514.97 / LARS 414 / MAFF 240422) TaxID=1213857 RepID=A0A484G9Y3_COLOR|nr:hypothetical protein Cob_v000471 [Colletotrichum orbiculare MAFF 240422]